MSERQRPEDAYQLSENERIFDRISHERFTSIIQDVSTRIHNLQVSANNYGEFLFVTTSRAIEDTAYHLTFWGLGYHEYRERWISQEWFWYQGYENSGDEETRLDADEALEIIQKRYGEIAPYLNSSQQTRQGELFELLADLTDDDGALTELDDLDDSLDFL